jgi:hypothetical protein
MRAEFEGRLETLVAYAPEMAAAIKTDGACYRRPDFEDGRAERAAT